MILDGARRFISKKMRKIDFLNTNYPQDYDAVNAEYKRLRRELDALQTVIENLSNYEFGGAVMKNFTKLGNRLSSTTSLKVFESKDIYSQAAFIGEEVSNTTHNGAVKSAGAKFSEAYQKISAAKRDMNAKLKDVLGSLKVLKDEIATINSLRDKADNLRYDLEVLIQDGNGSKTQVDSLTSEFNSKALEALRGMKTFMGDVGMAGLLKKAAAIHRDFNEDASRSLSNVQ